MMRPVRARLLLWAVFAPGVSMACPICHSPIGAEVRAGLFGPDLLANVVATLLPFPVLAGVVLLVRYFGIPGLAGTSRGKEDRDGAR
jgi:hypothetical protein